MLSGPTRSAGFTRIELLASTLALSVLLGLALPLIAGDPKTSRAALCQDNFRRLARALALYTLDHGWFPPNADNGSTLPGAAWVGGQAGPGGGQEFNEDLVRDASRSLLVPYLETGGNVFACPSDDRSGQYQGTDPAKRGRIVPAARSVAMNVAVGISPDTAGAPRPTNGDWLDNTHSHVYGRKWRTYGRPEHVVDPSPAGLYVLIDEDARSLNDAVIAFGMEVEEWIDWPGTRHELGSTLSYADGHVELHRWVDERTVVGASVARLRVPGSVDYRWLRDRTSAALPR